MNKERRRQISEVASTISACVTTLEGVRDAEYEAQENTPENFQSGDAYCTSERCSDTIEDVIPDLQEIVKQLEEIT